MPRTTAPRKAAGASKRAPSREVVDLDLDEIAESKKPSFTFRVGGQTFRCRDKDDLHWDTVEKWLIARETSAGEIAVNIDGFFRAVLYPDDVEAFMTLKADPEGPLTLARSAALLQEVNSRLFGIEGTADPTTRPASSGGGSRRNGTGSKVKHDGRVTTPA